MSPGCLLPSGGQALITRTTLEDPAPFRPPASWRNKRLTWFEPFIRRSIAPASVRSHPSHAGSTYELRRATHNLGQDFQRFPSVPGRFRPEIVPGKSPSPTKTYDAASAPRSILRPGPIVDEIATRFR